jgi:hypothetical protein
MAATDPQYERAENIVLKAVRDAHGAYSPGQVLQRVRHEADVPEYLLRSAMWRLLDERKLVLSADRKVSIQGE